MKNVILLFTVLILTSCTANSQTTSSNKKAQKLFDAGMSQFERREYKLALASFDAAAEKDLTFPDPFMMKGMAYVEMKEIDLAVENYEKAIAINPTFFPNIYEELGSLLLSQGKYEKAKKHYEVYLKNFPNVSRKMKIRAENGLDNCYFAIEAMANPVPFNPQNLGSNVNSEFHDFSPFVTLDEEYLYFSRTIPSEQSMDGQHEDFFRSKIYEDSYGKAENLGMPINSIMNEGAIAISPDGQYMIFTICDRFGDYGNKRKGMGTCDLFISKKVGDNWSPARNLGPNVNSSKWDGQGCLSSDGKTLYFASTRPGGRGESDIYWTTITEHGWNKPVNIGEHINTPGKEMGVFIHPDNQTLYFTSNGHVGMGGMDIYMCSRRENGSWGKPVNCGYPINTYENELSVFVDPQGGLAYITSNREGGEGSEDLYKFPVPKQMAPISVTYMKGKVYDHETGDNLEAGFELIDVESGKLIVSSTSNPKSGEFLVCLPIGRNYALNVSKKGYLFHSEKFELLTTGSNDEPYRKDVPLKKINIGEEIVLNNVFFNTDKFDLLDKSKVELDKLIDFLRKQPSMKIQIEGHTDSQGSSSNNKILSSNRAKSVVDYLVLNGISKDRLTHQGFGDTVPVGNNETEEGRAQNRRTTFRVMEK